MAMVIVGGIMRGSGVGMPSSRGEHVSLYAVVRWAAVMGGLQEKEREVSDDDTTAKFSTGLGSTHKKYNMNGRFKDGSVVYVSISIILYIHGYMWKL